MSSNGSELHVVFGSGAAGLSVVDVLVARGRPVRLVNRSGMADVPASVDVVPANAMDPRSTREVCRGATVVYNCTNARDYHLWHRQFPPLQAGVLEGAAANGAKLVVLENLYMYGPHQGQPMTEDMSMEGRGARSATRAWMAQQLLEAHRCGKVRMVSARASDFFGPRVFQSLMGDQVFRAAMDGKSAQVIINADTPHTYTYMPDIGRALVILGEYDGALGQAWHIPSPETVTTREFVRMIYDEVGNPFKMTVIPKAVIRAMELFVPPLRGICENFYQMDEPFVLDHSKFTLAFGNQVTPLRQAIRETVAWYREHLP